jgi:opacity protein-like surface antigen
MKKMLLSLTAAAALAAAAAPAAAQDWRGQNDGYRNDRPYAGAQRNNALTGLEWKIDNAAREGRLSRSEARNLLSELRQVQPIAWKVQAGRATSWERQRLERVVNRIERATYARYDRRDGRDYGQGYGQHRR